MSNSGLIWTRGAKPTGLEISSLSHGLLCPPASYWFGCLVDPSGRCHACEVLRRLLEGMDGRGASLGAIRFPLLVLPMVLGALRLAGAILADVERIKLGHTVLLHADPC